MQKTAAYGHMGREPKLVTKVFNKGKDNEKTIEVELFTWEKLDMVNEVKKHSAFNRPPQTSPRRDFRRPC